MHGGAAEQGDQRVDGRIDDPRGQRSGDTGKQSEIHGNRRKETNGRSDVANHDVELVAPSTMYGTQVKDCGGAEVATICVWPL